LIGDEVHVFEDCTGVVVCVIDSGEYSSEFPEEDWAYLEKGVLIRTSSGRLIHFIEPDEDLCLIKRRGSGVDSI